MTSMFACGSRAHRQGDRLIVPDEFSVVLPPDPPWKFSFFRHLAGRSTLVFKAEGTRATLSVSSEPLPAAWRTPPLEIVGELVFMRILQSRGEGARVESLSRILLDEREAVGMVGSRWERPRRWRSALVVVRGERRLATILLDAPEQDFDAQAGALELVLRHFRVGFRDGFDPYRLEDLPMGAPGPSPGNTTGRPSRPAPLPIPPASSTPF